MRPSRAFMVVMAEDRSPNIDRLLAESDWLGRVAAALVSDPHRADDVVQSTWLAALRTPPRRDGGLRGWLATVARNAARRIHREGCRRDDRERRSGSPTSPPDPADVVARVETQERVARAVRALDEPYRTAVVLRWFEGQTPREIAESLDVPLATVRTRLQRALERLRRHLDSETGDRRAWVLPLLPLLGRRPPTVAVATGASSAAVLGALLVSKKVLLAVAILGLGALVLAVRNPPEPAPAVNGQRAGRPGVADPGATQDPVAVVATGDSREESGTAPSDESRDWPIRIRTNVPGATVSLRLSYYGGEPDPELLVKTADETGFAGFDPPARQMPIHRAEATAGAEGHTIARAVVKEGKATLKLYPGRVVRGRVLDRAGRPVEGVLVSGSGFDRTDAEGEFEISAPARGSWRVLVTHPAYLIASPLLSTGDESLEVTLGRGLGVSGLVTDEQGRPLVGTWVAVDSDHFAQTGPDGRYRITGLRPGRHAVRCFIRLPHPPGDSIGSGGVSAILREADAGDVGVDFQLHLARSARIRVVDEEGRPFRHAKVDPGPTASPSGSTGETGELTITGRSPAIVTVTAPGRPPVTRSLELSADRPTHQIVLAPAVGTATLGLRVRDDGGEIPPQVHVTLLTATGTAQPGFVNRSLATDEEGRATLAGIPASRYRIIVSTVPSWVSRDGYGLNTVEERDLRAEERVTLDVTIAIGGRIRLISRDRAGESTRMSSSEAQLYHPRGGGLVGVPLGANVGPARFSSDDSREPLLTIQPLPVGRYLLRLRPRGAPPIDREVRVERGKTTDVEAVIDR